MSSVASRSTPTRDSARPEEDDALSDALGSASSHTVIIEGDVEVEVREEDEIDAAVVPFCDDAVGALEHEGHEITVWSLVCSPAGEVVCINCTGSHTSVSAALQRLLRKSGGGNFVPAEPGTWRALEEQNVTPATLCAGQCRRASSSKRCPVRALEGHAGRVPARVGAPFVESREPQAQGRGRSPDYSTASNRSVRLEARWRPAQVERPRPPGTPRGLAASPRSHA